MAVVIVGGGVAGIAAARGLEAAGIAWRLFEGSDRIGGRLKSDLVHGFRLDRGFQVYLPAYETASALFDPAALRPGRFRDGALVWDGAATRLLDRARPFATLRSPLFGLGDKLRTLRLARDLRHATPAAPGPDEATETYLRGRGFSNRWLDRFARPFFGGIFLDRSLGVSAAQFRFVYGRLARAGAVTFAEGIEAVPRAMAAPLPTGRIETDARIVAVERNAVRLASGERVAADAVILATDAPAAARLLPDLAIETAGKASTALWYAVPRPPVRGPYLVLNGSGGGRVNEVAPMTEAAPGLAPTNGHLLAVTVLGDPPLADAALDAAVRAELATWFPDAETDRWSLLRTDRIRYAQLRQDPGFADRRPAPDHPSGVILAGEWTLDGSIEGAARSGLAAASLAARRVR